MDIQAITSSLGNTFSKANVNPLNDKQYAMFAILIAFLATANQIAKLAKDNANNSKIY